MKTLPLGAVVLALLVPAAANGQTKTLPGELVTSKATVEAVEQGSRTLTLRLKDGTLQTVIAPHDMKKFDEIKVGDTVTARYYDSITIRKKAPGEDAVDSAAKAVTPADTTKPTGTAGKQRTITATVTDIDMKMPSITLKGPNGWAYSSRVHDKDALSKVQVGDRVDITWTEAMMVSVDASK